MGIIFEFIICMIPAIIVALIASSIAAEILKTLIPFKNKNEKYVPPLLSGISSFSLGLLMSVLVVTQSNAETFHYALTLCYFLNGGYQIYTYFDFKKVCTETKLANERVDNYLKTNGVTSFERFCEYSKTAPEFEKSMKLKFFNPYTEELTQYNKGKSDNEKIKFDERIGFKEFIMPYYYSRGCEYYKVSIKQLVYPPEPCPVFSRSDLRKHLSAYQGFFESINDYTCLNEGKSTEITYTKKETVKKAKKMITDAESNVLDQAIKEGIIRCIRLNNDNTLYESQIVPEKERYVEGETFEID